MAGSYNHVVTNDGNLGSNEWIVNMLETGGDVFEAVEELYGMIWWLAKVNVGEFDVNGNPVDQAILVERMKEWVESAQKFYGEGLDLAKEVHRISPDNRRGGDE